MLTLHGLHTVLVSVFYTSVNFKTTEVKTTIDPNKISEEIFCYKLVNNINKLVAAGSILVILSKS